MNGWPQITAAAWLALSACASLGAAVRPSRRWIAIGPKQQRFVALGFAAAAIGEANLLWVGGFWKGFF
ncbi:MAG: hypothetical protein ABIS14_12825 [Sphingomonas sp.]